jgi:hypothetical protein
MTAFTFYFPSNGDHDDQDKFMQQIWNERILDYLFYVRRVSLRGNPYIKGLFIVNGEAPSLPVEFEVKPIPDDCVDFLLEDFKEEQRIHNNATEYYV